MRHGRVSIAGVQLQVDLSVDQTFVVLVEVAEEEEREAIGVSSPSGVRASNVLSYEVLARLIGGDGRLLTIGMIGLLL